jgi:hypothetical protein
MRAFGGCFGQPLLALSSDIGSMSHALEHQVGRIDCLTTVQIYLNLVNSR